MATFTETRQTRAADRQTRRAMRGACLNLAAAMLRDIGASDARDRIDPRPAEQAGSMARAMGVHDATAAERAALRDAYRRGYAR